MLWQLHMYTYMHVPLLCRQRDEFKVSGPDVGEMNHVVVGHDGSGLGPAWHLAELEVQHMGTGQLLKFTANRWAAAA